jgi:soluble lytic murein transglycosylase-like protein
MESDWNYRSLGYATSKGRALGIAQALPASRMGSVSKNYKTDPLTQIKWGLGYIKMRYNNDSCRALRHEFNYGWY